MLKGFNLSLEAWFWRESSPHFQSWPTVCLVQIDQVKQDLSRKETELLGLQTKLETLNNQFSDSKQHIDVLKESLTAKEQRAAILQTEVRIVTCEL